MLPTSQDFTVHERANEQNIEKEVGAKIHIDVVSDAAGSLMAKVIATRSSPDQFGISINMFGRDTSKIGLGEVQPQTEASKSGQFYSD